MKIAFLNIYRNNNRGAESFVNELAARLSAKNSVTILGPEKDTWIVQPKSTTGFLKRFFLDPSSISVLLFSLKLLPRLLKEKPDLVIPMNGFWQVVICKFLGCKILITGHSGPAWDERWNLYLKPDVFVATTEPTAVWAKKTCPWTRVVVIPYGIDLKKFARGPLAKLDLERPLILCPAAAVEYKRVNLAIKAVSKLSSGSLIHLGSGPLKDEIADLGLKLLGKKRFLSTMVPYGEMPKYYSAADVVTLPSSDQENSPMVFLESMAAGKPVVTTDTPRARWILGQAGVFINPEQIEEYAKALEQRVDKKLINEQAEKYSWDKIIPLYEELINDL